MYLTNQYQVSGQYPCLLNKSHCYLDNKAGNQNQMIDTEHLWFGSFFWNSGADTGLKEKKKRKEV